MMVVIANTWAQTTPFIAAQVEDGTGCDWPFNAIATNPVDGRIYGFWRKGAGSQVTYKLIRWDDTSWSTVSTFTTSGGTTSATKVSGFEGAGDDVGLAIGSDGIVHVVFQGYRGSGNGSTRGVWYGAFDGASWMFDEIQTVSDPTGAINTANPVIDIGTGNQLAIAFRLDDATGNRTSAIRYYQRSDSGWSGQTAFSQRGANNLIGALDLAIDGYGRAYMAFQRSVDGSGLDGGLWYTTNAQSPWFTAELFHGTKELQQGKTISIDTDSRNSIYLVHSDSQDKLYYTSGIYSRGLIFFSINQINNKLTGMVRPHALQINRNDDTYLTYSYTNLATSPNSLSISYAYRLHNTTGNWSTGLVYTNETNAYGTYFSGLLTTEGRIMVLFDFASARLDCGPNNTRKLEYATSLIQVPAAVAPTVATDTASQIVLTGARLGGQVTADGGAPVTERGVVYLQGVGTPTTADTKVAIGSGLGLFFQDVRGLSPGTTYSARTYAINSGGTGYGSTVVFTTPPSAPTVLSPANGSILATRTPAFSGTALAGSTVTIYVDGQLLSSTVTSGSFSFTQPTELADGQHTVRAIALINGPVPSAVSTNSTTNIFTVDATAPVVSSVNVPTSGTYRAGQPLSFTVNFTEAVIVTGSPQLGLVIGLQSQMASYVSGSGSSALIFTYSVQPGEQDGDGIVLSSALTPAGGSIQDVATNNAALTLNNVPPTVNIRVNAVVPSVSISSAAGANGSTTGSNPIPFTITFSESVTGLAANAIRVTNGTLNDFTGNGTTYSFRVTPSNNGIITVNVPANVAQSAVGNANQAAAPFIITYLTITGFVAGSGSGFGVRLLNNPIVGDVLEADVLGAAGQPLSIQLTDSRGQVVVWQQLGTAGEQERLRLYVGQQAAGLLLLQVSIPSGRQVLRVLKAN